MGSLKRSRTVDWSSKRKASSNKRTKTKHNDKAADYLLGPMVSTKMGLVPGFPKKFKFKHKYTQIDQIATTTVALEKIYRANGMFDPDVSLGGHQPLYFDQLTTLYNYNFIISSKVKWTIVPAGTSAQVPYRVIAYTSPSGSATADAAKAAEQTGANHTMCAGGLNPDKIVLYSSYNATQVFGPGVLSNPQLRGTATADPNEQSYFHLMIHAVDGGSLVSVQVMAEIEYTAVWDEAKLVNQS